MAHKQHGFDAELGRLADDARRAEATNQRRSRADRSVVAALSASFAGTLEELSETSAPALFLLRSGDTIRGTVGTVGRDLVTVHSSGGARVLLRTWAIEAVRETGAGHDRDVVEDADGPQFADALDELANDRRRLSMTLASGNRLMGVIERVGQDQVVLRLDGGADSMTVNLGAIDQVVIDR